MGEDLKPKPKIIKPATLFSFVRNTGYFLIAGLFLQGITAMILVGFQMLFEKLGLECPQAYTIVFLLAFICALLAPNLFVRYFAKVDFTKVDMSKRLVIFNFAELAFIQGGLSLLFSDPNTLCYVTDGQNGMEIYFAGLLALPILILLSWRFDVIHKTHLRKRLEGTSDPDIHKEL